MGKSVVEQKLLEYPDVFADVYNAYCFGGESILKEEELEPMMAVAYTRNVDNEVRGRLRDVRKKCLLFSGRYPVICQIENQTDIDNTMPVRIMGYEYAAYEEQIDKYQDEVLSYVVSMLQKAESTTELSVSTISRTIDDLNRQYDLLRNIYEKVSQSRSNMLK